MLGGIESAVSQAKIAAAGKSVGVHGANTIQQCLNAGLLDQIHVDIAAVLLGSDKPATFGRAARGLEREGLGKKFLCSVDQRGSKCILTQS